jgi:hypothetical protein
MRSSTSLILVTLSFAQRSISHLPAIRETNANSLQLEWMSSRWSTREETTTVWKTCQGWSLVPKTPLESTSKWYFRICRWFTTSKTITSRYTKRRIMGLSRRCSRTRFTTWEMRPSREHLVLKTSTLCSRKGKTVHENNVICFQFFEIKD